MCAKVLLMTDDLNIIIKRSANRKSASLAIYPDQRIVVSVPNRFPDARVEALIRDKINWIQKKLSELRALPQLKTYELKEGESLPFLGEELRLTFQVSSKSSVLRVENALLVSLPMSKANDQLYLKKTLFTWYQQQVLALIRLRVDYYAERLSVSPKNVSVRTYRNRWGTCKSSGDLIFNWKLVFGSPLVLDYVVIHELSHLKEFNHSPRFWGWVQSVMPHYRDAQKELKQLSAQCDSFFK